MRTIAVLGLLTLLAACDPKTPGAPLSPAPGTSSPPLSPTSPATPAVQGEQTYYFGVRETHTNITFQSKNDLTDILGASHQVSGSATVDFGAGTGRCVLSVPTASLNSGMADRDRAMMGPTWLDVKKYPAIEFKGEKASITDKPNGWTVDGKFTLHGVTRDLSVKAEVRALPAAIGQKLGFGDGPCIKVKTSFKVKLADYGIEIPSTAIATVQPEISVAIDIWGSTVKPAAVEVKAPVDDETPIKVAPKPKVSEEGLEGTKYVFGKKPQLAQMTATSETEVETITASTKVLAGALGFDPAKGTGMVRIAVPVDQLRTGIDLRDQHLRSADWLDAAKFKTMNFESTQVAKKDERTWSVTGDLTLHGVKKPLTVEVVLREIPLALIQKAHWGETPGLGFATKFKVKLSDFGVKIPPVALAKVNDEWTVSIDLVALQKE